MVVTTSTDSLGWGARLGWPSSGRSWLPPARDHPANLFDVGLELYALSEDEGAVVVLHHHQVLELLVLDDAREGPGGCGAGWPRLTSTPVFRQDRVGYEPRHPLVPDHVVDVDLGLSVVVQSSRPPRQRSPQAGVSDQLQAAARDEPPKDAEWSIDRCDTGGVSRELAQNSRVDPLSRPFDHVSKGGDRLAARFVHPACPQHLGAVGTEFGFERSKGCGLLSRIDQFTPPGFEGKRQEDAARDDGTLPCHPDQLRGPRFPFDKASFATTPSSSGNEGSELVGGMQPPGANATRRRRSRHDLGTLLPCARWRS